MIVRPATHDDIPRIVDMAQRFYPTSGYERIAPLAKESAAGLVIVAAERGVMLVAEVDGDLAGMACLVVEPYLFNVEVVIAQEIVWWIEPEHRGGMLAVRLLKASIDACAALGATVIRMATLPHSPPQASALLERMGFVPSENYFTKVL